MVEEINIPEGVTVVLEHDIFSVTGKEGTVRKHFPAMEVSKEIKGGKIVLTPSKSRKKCLAMTNTYRSIVTSMVAGVQSKFIYKLKMIYSHFPITLSLKGKELHIINFGGEKNPRIVKIPDSVEVKIKGRDLTVTSVDKEAAGITAGLIEKTAVIKGRDRRVYQDGIYITEKGVQNEN